MGFSGGGGLTQPAHIGGVGGVTIDGPNGDLNLGDIGAVGGQISVNMDPLKNGIACYQFPGDVQVWTVENTGQLGIFPQLAGWAIAISLQTDAQSRLQIFTDGSLNFGSGAAALDTVLQRIAAGVLAVTTGFKLAAGSTLYSGAGAPAAGLGANGDFYFRNDTPGTANQRIYTKNAGAWTGIL